MEASTPNHDTQFVALLTEIQLSLTLYVQSLLPGDRQASDVAQQANAKIWEKRHEFEVGTNFKAWSFAIARFVVLNYRKQQAKQSRLQFSHDLEQTLAEDLAAQNETLAARQEALQQCLSQLGDGERDLLLHRYASSETLADYAIEVGRSASALKVALSRLRGKLLACITRRLRQADSAYGEVL